VIRAQGSSFTDEHGRTLILRGVNLGGSSKVPFTPNGATHLRDGFFEHRHVSFVGRPFPLDQADEHFTRLREWGFTFLRLLVTWEAVEHAGPGEYDEAYLDYLWAVVKQAGDYGFDVLIDPHQDVWSRFAGGDGAPGWTFEAVGLDVTQFAETGAAMTHQAHGDPFPHLLWPSNETRLAAATLFTLFFGGDDFAPATRLEGQAAQSYLQRHYIAAVARVAQRLKDLPNVVGYGTLNEPSPGYIGWPDLRMAGGQVKKGPCPSPYQAMLLGAGFSQTVDVWDIRWSGFKRIGVRALNTHRARAWLPGHDCVWRQNGVWDIGPDGSPRLLRPHYFAERNGRPVDFSQDYYLPFARRFAEAVRAADPRTLVFVESAPRQPPPRWHMPGVVYAPHWYDGFVLALKRYSRWLAVDFHTGRLVFGPGRIRRSFAAQLNRFKREAIERLNDAPVLIGEFGIPFNLQEGRAYRTRDFSAQIQALDRTLRTLEDTLLSGALWNYTADNTNARGDLWNGEDLSIFSRDQPTDPTDIHSGGRALLAAVRPYTRKIAGEPLRMVFDVRRRVFEFEFRHDASVSEPTEVFVPNHQYPQGCVVKVSDGTYSLDQLAQTLRYRHSLDRPEHTIRIQAV
jgi:hypothetical protein